MLNLLSNKKNYIKIFIAAVGVLLLISQPIVYAEDYSFDSYPFKDIDEKYYFLNDFVNYLYSRDLIFGTSKTTFSPDRLMTRAQFVSVLGKIYEYDNDCSISDLNLINSPYIDISPNAYYHKYVMWAYKNNLISGYPDGTFRPNGGLSYEMAAVILSSYIENLNSPVAEVFHSDLDLNDYKNSFSLWAYNAIKDGSFFSVFDFSELFSMNEFPFMEPLKQVDRYNAAGILALFADAVTHPSLEYKDTPHIQYEIDTYADGDSSLFLENSDDSKFNYKIVKNYSDYEKIAKQALGRNQTDESTDTTYEMLGKNIFKDNNVIIIETASKYGSYYQCYPVSIQQESNTVSLKFYENGLSGWATATGTGYLFFAVVPKGICNVTITSDICILNDIYEKVIFS